MIICMDKNAKVRSYFYKYSQLQKIQIYIENNIFDTIIISKKINIV